MRTIPQGARLALVLCAVLAAIDIVGPLLPDSEGEIAFGIVAAALSPSRPSRSREGSAGATSWASSSRPSTS
jgi:hypothetical protein